MLTIMTPSAINHQRPSKTRSYRRTHRGRVAGIFDRDLPPTIVKYSSSPAQESSLPGGKGASDPVIGG